MNENIDLTKILKDCPVGTKLYSPICGEVYFIKIDSDCKYSIITNSKYSYMITFTKEGHQYDSVYGECLLFPSKDQRDWSKFKAFWYKKDRFNPKTLKPFDKVLARDLGAHTWRCTLYSHTKEDGSRWKYVTDNNAYECCIPYNNDTKHLIGTSNEAPEFYRYWED